MVAFGSLALYHVVVDNVRVDTVSFCGDGFRSCCSHSLLSCVLSSLHKYTCVILYSSFVSLL